MRVVDGLKFFGIVVATIATTWATLEWLEIRPVYLKEFKQLAGQVYDMNLSLQLQRYNFLISKRDSGGGLTPEEWFELCKLSELLGFETVGCR